MLRAVNRAVFLDRDGTLIEDREYPGDPADVRLLPGVPDGLCRLRAAGFACVVITNQSGIGRGLITGDDCRRVHRTLSRRIDRRSGLALARPARRRGAAAALAAEAVGGRSGV